MSEIVVSRLDRPPVVLPPLAGAATDLWTLLVDLAQIARVPWTLVGGQMVMLHGLEQGRLSPRVSVDIDTVVDVRTDPRALQKLVEVLAELGLEPAGYPSPQGIMCRYVKPGTQLGVDLAVSATSVDLLVPEGLGPNTDTTTSMGGRAFPAPGTSQALDRTELVPVSYEGREAWVPRPDLLGAIVGKAVGAVEDNHAPVRHIGDLVFLCSLINDPFVMRDRLGTKDRKRLRAVATRLNDGASIWASLGEWADDARSAWSVLLASG